MSTICEPPGALFSLAGHNLHVQRFKSGLPLRLKCFLLCCANSSRLLSRGITVTNVHGRSRAARVLFVLYFLRSESWAISGGIHGCGLSDSGASKDNSLKCLQRAPPSLSLDSLSADCARLLLMLRGNLPAERCGLKGQQSHPTVIIISTFLLFQARYYLTSVVMCWFLILLFLCN